MCQVSWSLVGMCEQIALALLCKCLDHSMFVGQWMKGLEVEVAVCVGTSFSPRMGRVEGGPSFGPRVGRVHHLVLGWDKWIGVIIWS